MSFSTAIAKRDTKKIYGFKISLPANGTGAYAFYVAEEEVGLGTGFYFQPLLMDHSSISYDMALGQPVCRISDVTITLMDKYASGQTYGSLTGPTLADMIQEHEWYGAGMLGYLLCEDEDGTWYIQQIWWGKITEWEHDPGKRTITVTAEAMRDLDAELPTTVITQATHADPPDASVGVCEPLVYGDLEPEYADSSAAGAVNYALEAIGYGRHTRVFPAICYDRASDDPTANVKFRAAGHDLKDFGGSAYFHGAFYYIEELKQLACMANPDFVNGSGYADLEIDLSGGEQVFSVHIDPYYVNATYNTATDPEKAMNRNVDDYATLDASNDTLMLDITKAPDLGYISQAWVLLECDYDLTHGAGAYAIYGFFDTTGGAIDTWSQTTGGTGSRALKSHQWTTVPAYGHDWDSTKDYAVCVKLYNCDTGDYFHVRAIGCVIHYYPRLIIPREDLRTVDYYSTPQGGFIRRETFKRSPIIEAIPPSEFLPLDSANSPIFVSGEGKADDGSGTVTGSADSRIDAPGDIVHDILLNEVGVASGRIITTGHGNVQDAADDQDTDNVEMAFALNERSPAIDLIQKICRQSGMGFFQAPSDGDYGLVYWGSPSTRNDYGTPIDFDDVIDIKILKTSLADIKNDIHVDYDYSYVTRKFTRHAYQDASGDDDGDGGSTYTSSMDFSGSDTAYGTRSWNLKLDLIHDIEAACKVRNIYADMLVLPRVKLRLTLPLKYWDIEPGHLIEMDHDSFIANGVWYPGSFSGYYTGYWTQGANHHYFWVEKITFDKRGFMLVTATEGVF